MKRNWTVIAQNASTRLDIFVASKEPSLTRSFIKNLITQGKILVNDSHVKAGFSLSENDKISAEIPAATPTQILPEPLSLSIIYQDADLLIVDKPQGMVVHPTSTLKTGTLVNALLHSVKTLSTKSGETRPGIVHRIDKDTSGLLVVAKNDATHISLQKQIAEHSCQRNYLAVVHGTFTQPQGLLTSHLARGKRNYEKIFVVPPQQGRLAQTYYEVLKSTAAFSLVEFSLKTGRTHQIRVQSASMGHPVVGDKKYGKKSEKFSLNGQLLHSHKLAFIHPKTHEKMEFTSPLPQYFEAFLLKNNLK